jgi:hypothetical protein
MDVLVIIIVKEIMDLTIIKAFRDITESRWTDITSVTEPNYKSATFWWQDSRPE